MSFIREDDDPRTVRQILAIVLASALAIGAIGWFSGCRTGPPVVVPPQLRPIAVRTCVPGALVRIDGAGSEGRPDEVADAFGDLATNVLAPTFNLHVTAPGYPEYGAVVTVGPPQLLLGPCVPLTDKTLQQKLFPWRPLLDAGERGLLHVDGTRFVTETGETWRYRGYTHFLLFARYLAGEDIDALLQEPIDLGANVVRVFGMLGNFGGSSTEPITRLYPQEHQDYYASLDTFVTHLADHGLRVEFTVFADAQRVMPDPAQEDVHADRVTDVLARHWNALEEAVNESFQNIPGGEARAVALARREVGHGVLVTSGTYGEPLIWGGDYGTVHPDRGEEKWPRTSKDLYDLSQATGIPWVMDEPIGAAEVPIAGRRANDPDDFRQFAALAALEGSGATFHSDGGIWSAALGPNQRAAAVAFYFGLRWPPADAQLAPYERGTDVPGCNWVGPALVEHDDARELRSFGKVIGDLAWAVQVRTSREAPTACPPWRIVDVPARGLAQIAH